MKKTPSPRIVYSSQMKEKPDTRHGNISKNNNHAFPGLRYIIDAAKKVTGIFRNFLPGRQKSNIRNGAIDESGSISQVSRLSCKSLYKSATMIKV